MFENVSTEQLETAITDISKKMSGPLPGIERMLLHADRHDLREELRHRRELENKKAAPVEG